METKVWGCFLSVWIGSIFLEVCVTSIDRLMHYSLTIISVITRIQPYGYTAQGTVFKFDWLYIVHVCTALLMIYDSADMVEPVIRVVFVGVYYNNIWESRSLPFVSPFHHGLYA